MAKQKPRPSNPFFDIITKFKTAELVEDLGDVKEVTIRSWRARGIPSDYWPEIVASAHKRGIQGITLEKLALLGARNVDRAPQKRGRAA